MTGSNADFLERMEKNKQNRLDYLNKKVGGVVDIKGKNKSICMPKNNFIPADPFSQEKKILSLSNDAMRKAWRESKLNKSLLVFI